MPQTWFLEGKGVVLIIMNEFNGKSWALPFRSQGIDWLSEDEPDGIHWQEEKGQTVLSLYQNNKGTLNGSKSAYSFLHLTLSTGTH